MSSQSGQLPPKLEATANALAHGATQEAAGAIGGVHARTVRRWLQESVFRDRVRAIRAETMDGLSGRLGFLGSAAVDTLEAVLTDPLPGPRLAAARSILENLVRLRSAVDLEVRVADLEQRLAEKKDVP